MKYLLFAATIFFISCTGNSTEKPQKISNEISKQQGEELFKANCALCHKPAEEYIGPALKAVESRWPNKELLYDFVRNSQEVISRNEYAKQLFEKYRQSPMLPFPQLKNEEIDAILDYCNTAQ
jgi:mono/diheme cytochrome c family protein